MSAAPKRKPKKPAKRRAAERRLTLPVGQAPKRRTLCEERGHDFVMAGEDPSIDECTRCRVRRY